MEEPSYLHSVRAQYEAYPYPPRNPEDEAVRLENSWYDFLELINFYCFEGKNNFSGEFRVLVVGGGTGDQTIFLAEQLRHNRRAQIVHLDISTASTEIAKRRAQIRRLSNITWICNSLLELPSLGLGQFDYISCIGVLHHLTDPALGLKALTSVLKEHGAIMIMLYGRYGRTGVYQMQELMRRVNDDEQDMQVMIDNTKAILHDLPKTNWFKRGEDLITDHKEQGDAGIYDVFLHAQDRAYTVEELYELVESCGLRIIELLERGKAKYMPESYIRDKGLLEKVARLPRKQQQAIAELITGDLFVHNFYASRRANTVPPLDDLRYVPFFFLYSPENLTEQLEKRPGQKVSIKSDLYGTTIEFMPGKYTRFILKYLDGERSLKEIFDAVTRESMLSAHPPSYDDLLLDFKPVYEQFNAAGWMLLRHKSVGRFRSLEDMQRPS